MLSENWRAGYAETCTSGSEGRVAKPRVVIHARRVALTLHLALASQLLPTARNRGKDFGLINTAIFLPMLLAPGLAGIALSLFQSYAVLFSVIAVGTILAAALILPIKSVR